MNSGPLNGAARLFDPARWARIEQVLEEALGQAPDAAEAALDRICGADPELRAVARALLAADSQSGDFLESPALESAASLIASESDWDDDEAPGPVGARIGPYHLLREIGRGGMGRVYLADRADGQFEQQVAIKLLKRGVDTDEILARFLRERQILARLEHPNIARLLDGGATEEGLPWFALEYVEGVPITRYGDERALDLRDTLRLFLQACRAVAHAHRALVVHRDLKPGNIYVSTKGSVKLLDFGIAKLLGDGEESAETLGSLRPHTPLYASPEQLRGEPITTSTDVYSLGIVLYELLAGERPHRGSSPEGFRKAVLEELPESPSARLRRSPKPGRRALWSRAMRGDLDNIVLQAIHREPGGRYPSAEALAEEIERYLEGRPVRASGRRFSYVAGKFIQRNRVAFGAACVVFLSLAAGLVATAWQSRVAASERDRARLEAKKAEQLKDFTLSLFTPSDPDLVAHAGQATARELLDRGASRVDRELRGQPELQAEMWDFLASVYINLRIFDAAIDLENRALAVRRRLHPGDDRSVASSLRNLGRAYQEKGDFPRAMAPYREAVAMQKRLGAAAAGDLAYSLGELADLVGVYTPGDEAEPLYHEALRTDSLVLGMDHVDTATDLDNFGEWLYKADRYDEALPYLRRGLDIRERHLGHDHNLTAIAMANLANCLVEVGEIDTAIVMLRQSIAIRRRWLPPDHTDLAHAVANLGDALNVSGDYPGAIDAFREAIRIRLRQNDPKDPFLAQEENDLAVAFYHLGQLDSAEVYFKAALRGWDGVVPPANVFITTARTNLGVILRETGRLPESEAILRDVLAIRERTLKPNDLQISFSTFHLGKALRLRGRSAEAEAMFRRALAVRIEDLGTGHPRVAEVEEALASLCRDAGRTRESAALYDSALAICRASFSAPHPQTADVLVGKGRLLLRLRRPVEAEAGLREALEIRANAFSDRDPRVGEARVALGLCLRALHRMDEGGPLLLSGLPALERRPGPPDPLEAEGRAALRADGL